MANVIERATAIPETRVEASVESSVQVINQVMV